MNTLAHGYDPALVSRHLGRPVTCVTRESDYLFPDGEDIAAAIAATIAGDPAPLSVPESVESHKARIELIVRGEWAQIQAIVDAMPELQRLIATEALYAPHYSRSSPMLAALAQAMGWSSADVDERFAAAAARVV